MDMAVSLTIGRIFRIAFLKKGDDINVYSSADSPGPSANTFASFRFAMTEDLNGREIDGSVDWPFALRDDQYLFFGFE